jgi:hypothetical protein
MDRFNNIAWSILLRPENIGRMFLGDLPIPRQFPLKFLRCVHLCTYAGGVLCVGISITAPTLGTHR